MFEKNTKVAWTTRSRARGNDYMGIVLDSNEHSSVVKVTSTALKSSDIGRSFSVPNIYLGDISSGQATVARMKS